jgi:ubiquitin carboxyl-terminal hydrolase 34
MGSIEGSSLFPKIAAILLAIAFLFHLIAIGAPWWARTDTDQTDRKEHIGLWRYCTSPIGGGHACNDFVEIWMGDWIKAVQSFMILALFTMPAALGITAAYAFVAQMEGNMKILGTAIALTAVTGLFVLVTVASFGGKYQEYFDNKEPNWTGLNIGVLEWAFGLAVTDGILTFIALGLLIASAVGGDEPY